MNKITRIIFLLVLSMLASTTFAEDFIIGRVVEHSPDKEIIQLCDSMYKVDQVYHNNGVDPEMLDLRTSIYEGSVVQVYPTTKTADYWMTEKVIILTGREKAHMVEKYGVTCNFQTNQSQNPDDD